MIIAEEQRRLVFVSAAYAALTFVMAYPLSASPGTTVVVDAPDTHVYIWTLAWDVHAFLNQPLRIFDANIYHPFPYTLAFSENLIGSAFFAAPFIWLTGNMVLGMNMAALITCVLCGIGGYVLARALHLRPGAAFLCGETGIAPDIPNSAAYIDHWRQRLSRDPRLVVTAAQQAQRAADHILGRGAKDVGQVEEQAADEQAA